MHVHMYMLYIYMYYMYNCIMSGNIIHCLELLLLYQISSTCRTTTTNFLSIPEFTDAQTQTTQNGYHTLSLPPTCTCMSCNKGQDIIYIIYICIRLPPPPPPPPPPHPHSRFAPSSNFLMKA